jgi:hypothetical protein
VRQWTDHHGSQDGIGIGYVEQQQAHDERRRDREAE